jgi:hypothetical protein
MLRAAMGTLLSHDVGAAGLTDAPCGGASAASRSYSAALFRLKGNADATSCVPAAFSATMSPAPDASDSAGPLTVVRLLRTVLLILVFAGRDAVRRAKKGAANGRRREARGGHRCCGFASRDGNHTCGSWNCVSFDAGIVVARNANDLIRIIGDILIDRRAE